MIIKDGTYLPEFGTRVTGGGDLRGYGSYRLWGYGDTIASGRSEGDEYSQPPLNIPLSVDPNTDEAALVAISLGIDYGQAQSVNTNLAAAVNNWNNQIALFSAKLTEALANASGANAASLGVAVSNWQQTASEFQDFGNQMVTGIADQSKIPQWQALGDKLLNSAQAVISGLGAPGLSLSAILAGFPQGISNSTDWLLQLAKKPINAATDETVRILLLVGGAAVVILFLAKSAGVKLNIPFVSI